MKTHHSTCRWFAIAIILAMTLAVSPSCPATSAEAGGSSSPERAQAVAAPVGLTESEQRARRAWRAEMSKRPVPKNGCYHAAYPDTEWREVQCGRPSPVPNQPRKGGGANIVGNGADYAAKTSGLISSVTGSFLSPTSSAGESGDVAFTTIPPNSPASANNVFTLQINTQANFLTDGSAFSTPACNGHAGCFGWQQFIHSQTQGPAPTGTQVSAAPGVNRLPFCPTAPATGPCTPGGESTPGVFVEYWLFNYGASCPALPSWDGMPAGTLWNNDGTGNCWFNGPISYIEPLTAADFAPEASGGLIMTASVTASQDKLVLATSSSMALYQEPSALGLSAVWTDSEFNVFGDCCGTQANFVTPTVLTVQNGIDDTPSVAPTCKANDGSTGETNNLSFEPIAAPVCCQYGGTSPAIEFIEDTGGGNAACGPTQVEGDPHLTTADGTHFDFQGAGEFVTLRDRGGMEIQTRQTPISTTFFPTPNAYDGLATCVSINTAVAARVGDHRVTWEPNLNGVPDPSGLQLRVDGIPTTLGPQGLALGTGGRVAPAAGGALEVDFPDGKTLMATPQWWADQSKWYLNVDIAHFGIVTDVAGSYPRGIAGPIAAGSWLPALPNGASVGPMPTSLPERYDVLYEKFADAWRVTDRDSLFDYAPGASTSTYTMKDWPKQNPPCEIRDQKPVEPASEATAVAACSRVRGENRRADCIFDVRVTGNPGFAQTYLDTQRNVALSTATSLTDGDNPSQPGEWVTFTAFVAPYSTTATGVPSGTVQFAVDGSNAGEPITVDANGRARWDTSRLKIGVNRVTATYLPGADSAFLPSTSLDRIHEVRRCPCGEQRRDQ